MEKFIIETKLQPVEFNPFAGPAIVHTAPSIEAQRSVDGLQPMLPYQVTSQR